MDIISWKSILGNVHVQILTWNAASDELGVLNKGLVCLRHKQKDHQNLKHTKRTHYKRTSTHTHAHTRTHASLAAMWGS